MDEVAFGDVVLLKFPFMDGQQFKKRPALVLLDTQDGDIIVCRIGIINEQDKESIRQVVKRLLP